MSRCQRTVCAARSPLNLAAIASAATWLPTYIPIGAKHRLENPGKLPHLIEVQSGGYLGEDDIVRFEDRYRRS